MAGPISVVDVVSSSHEALHRIFHHDSEMLSKTFRTLGLALPTPDTVSVVSGDVTEIRPLERRIDTLLRCETVDGEAYLVLVEAQRSCDDDKTYSWMYYIAYLADRYKLPVLLLVVCQDKRVARWASQPFKRGAGAWAALALRALVVGPHNVPAVVDEEEARHDVLLTLFSVLTHANDTGIDAILRALASALKTMEDEEKAYDLAELTLIGLDDTPAGAIWRQMMAMDLSFYRSSFSRQLIAEGLAEGRVEGRAEGRAVGLAEGRGEAVLRVLDKRGVAISAEQRACVEACTDLDQLDLWLDRAVTAADASEVFDTQ